MLQQDTFDTTIGRLDWCISVMMIATKDPSTCEANRQTLKHHAEDMVAAGQVILKLLGKEQDGAPQPTRTKV